MNTRHRSLAIITGISSRIGFALARQCAVNGHDVIIASDKPDLVPAATALSETGARITAVDADICTAAGAERIGKVRGGREVKVFIASIQLRPAPGLRGPDPASMRGAIDKRLDHVAAMALEIGKNASTEGQSAACRTGASILLVVTLNPGRSSKITECFQSTARSVIQSRASALDRQLSQSGSAFSCVLTGHSSEPLPLVPAVLQPGTGDSMAGMAVPGTLLSFQGVTAHTEDDANLAADALRIGTDFAPPR